MKLTDILPRKKWEALEKEINQRFGLNATVFDKDGIRITDYKKWANSLCPAIKGNEQGQKYICSVAHQNIAGTAEKKKKSVVGECDAGLVKIVVPVFAYQEFIGVVGGCGKIITGNEVEAFLISMITGVNHNKVVQLSKDIIPMTTEDSEKIVGFIKQRLGGLLNEFGKLPKQDVAEALSLDMTNGEASHFR